MLQERRAFQIAASTFRVPTAVISAVLGNHQDPTRLALESRVVNDGSCVGRIIDRTGETPVRLPKLPLCAGCEVVADHCHRAGDRRREVLGLAMADLATAEVLTAAVIAQEVELPEVDAAGNPVSRATAVRVDV